MRVLLVSRYPRVDTPGWKRELAQGLTDRGHEVGVVYSRSAIADQLAAGVREFGAGALVGRYLKLSRRAPSAADVGGEVESLAAWASAHDRPVLPHRRLGDPDCLAAVRDFAPDLLLLTGSDLVPAALLEIPTRGALNPHYGLLPRYRGMNVTEWAIYHDDPLGVTVHFVSPGIDTGDVVATRAVAVERGDSLETLRPKHQVASTALLLEAAEAVAEGTVERRPQELGEGRQFYRMHPELRAVVEGKLARGDYRWTDRRAPDEPLLGPPADR